MALEQESLRKRKIIESLENLPEEATVEDFIEHLSFLIAVEDGIADIEAGRTITQEELVERVKTWLK